jgi:hypothetical protein
MKRAVIAFVGNPAGNASCRITAGINAGGIA